MIPRGLGAGLLLAAASLLPGCATKPAGPPAISAPLAQSSEFTVKAPAVRHVIAGCEPCAIYSLDVNARRAAYPSATAAGVLTIFGGFRPGDRIKLTLYRRRPCR